MEVYLNVAGREKQGVVEPEEQNAVLDELTAKLRHIQDKDGRALDNKTFKRRDICTAEGVEYGPDLFVYFGNYSWSTSELIGYDSICSCDIPGHQDDASHRPYGFLVFYGPGVPKGGQIARATLPDIAPSVLKLMDVEVPQGMEGRALVVKEEGLRIKETEEGL